MFGLGTWELVLVLVVAVLFLGPDKLPELAKTLGKSVRSIQKAMGGVDTTMWPVQNAARKLNESIEKAVDIDGLYSDEHEQSEQDERRDNSPQAGENDPGSDGPIASADPFGPVVPEEPSPQDDIDRPHEAASEEGTSDESPQEESTT